MIDTKIGKQVFPACKIDSHETVMVDKNGRAKRKASFHYVDDRIVKECMTKFYNIPTPKAGKGFAHGLQTHSWQALGVATTYLHNSTSNHNIPNPIELNQSGLLF